LVLSAADVQVTIGDAECSVTSLSSTQLTCLPNVTASHDSHAADLFVRFTSLSLLLPTPLSYSQVLISSYMVSEELFPDRSRPSSCTKWGLAQSPSCDCGQRQTMNDVVDTCPLTKFVGELNLLHEAYDDAVIWLESTATAALTK